MVEKIEIYKPYKEVVQYEKLGYTSKEEFLEELLGCDSEYTLEDFYDSYDPD